MILGDMTGISDQSAGQWETGTDMGEVQRAGNGEVHISAAGVILLVILLKAFTESNLISTDLAEIKISLLNILSIWLMWKAGDIAVTWVTAEMAKRGLALPGQVEVVRL
jgi:hypothetical protein